MQERFCECGKAVKVDFQRQARVWAAVIRTQRHVHASGKAACPVCGRILTIDTLR